MFKKSGLLVSSFPGVYACHSASSMSTTSLSGRRSTRRQQQQCRTYAMVADGHSRHHHRHETLLWPEIKSKHTIPTPYQIFNQKKGSKYSKHRFYELVKLYHPDRHDHAGSYDGLSYETKLERYRLVVAANDILSDPIKRGAYDCYGAGWNGAPDVKRPQDAPDTSASWSNYYSARGWAGGPQGPSQNATWEDWERWYQRDAKGPQEPAFVSNGTFVVLIVTFAIVGGVGQFTRLGDFSMKFLAQSDALHDEMSKELMRRRKETTTIFGSREERIDSFLRQRDPIGYASSVPRDERPSKLLPPPPSDAPANGDLKERTLSIHQTEGNSKNG